MREREQQVGETDVTFLLPVISQARFRKRIQKLRELGVRARVFSFTRDYFEEDRSVHIAWTSLGTVRHGNYIRRLRALFRAVHIVRRAVPHAEVLYAFGLDLLLVAYLAALGGRGRPRLVYEVGDIRSILLRRGPAGALARLLERYLLARVQTLVVTSSAYYHGYYRGVLKPRRLPTCVVVENKIQPELLAAAAPDRATGSRGHGRPRLRIGYFGLLRCRRTWQILTDTVGRHGDRVELLVRGLPLEPPLLEEEARRLPGVSYGGTFLSPTDLPAMYGSVDLVWAAYPWEGTRPGNSKWARTNRFYEACYFQRPMLVQLGTEDARVVAEYDIGLCVDMTSVDSAVRQIAAISDQEMQRWQLNLRRLPRELYADADEHARLYHALRECSRRAPDPL